MTTMTAKWWRCFAGWLAASANGGPSSDPHRLDRDNDGIACEDN
jgi:hypothetical protein